MTSPSSPVPPDGPVNVRVPVPQQGPAPMPGVVPPQGPAGPWAGQPTGWVPPAPPAAWPHAAPLAPNGRPLASFGDRLLAFLLDGLIVGAVGMIFTIPLMVLWMFAIIDWTEANSGYTDAYGQPVPDDFFRFFGTMFIAIGAVFVVQLLVTYLYFVEYQLRKGGETIGKRVLKLRVVKVRPEQALTRGDLTKRWAVERVVGVFVPFFSYLDGFWQLWDKPLQQCLHDKAAQTVVVKVG
ncbi:RDD family protein [Catellatospora sichuanensis]|uniref:RDD family protein n=1 Tax=Catellatospora sichuanensis TaxID=1969805 RepID=UPI001642E562|nr:RDD family protein [Catellatospora sichuanensis]